MNHNTTTQIIAVANQKGGTGKTTTVVNLGAALAQEGYKVLLLDLDPQASLTFHLGAHHHATSPILEVFEGNKALSDRFLKRENMTLSPADHSLSNVEEYLLQSESREYHLKKSLDSVVSEYDYILMDCGPTLSMLTINALVASNQVLIPLELEVLSLHGLSKMAETIFNVKEIHNSTLKVLGVLPVMVDMRRNVTSEVLDFLKDNFGFPLFPSIGVDVRVVESPSFGQSVVQYAPSSAVTIAYKNLATMVIKSTPTAHHY
ncbi:ParA family protein [Algivirga pacifica]|uniref:AAA family ATPase n=1 Tax=Algivirga pacifica TaxID=1162670 RepID=A0ABP9DHB9_9BACT